MTSRNNWLPKPFVFTPFLRRFTDEKSRDIAETRELLANVAARHRACIWSGKDSIQYLTETVMEGLAVEPPRETRRSCYNFAKALFELEKPIFQTVSDVDVAKLSLQELVDLRRFLRSQEHFLDHAEDAIDTLVGRVQGIIEAINSELPGLDAPSPFTVPLVHLMPNPGWLVERIVGTTSVEDVEKFGLFAEVGSVIDDNINAAYKINPDSPPKRKLPSISDKTEDEDWGPQEVTDKFLKNTPFHDLLMAPLPLKFDLETRFSHVHVVGGSGAGKTQLLQNLILNDLQAEDPPTLIVVDSQGDLINKLSRLDLFRPGSGALAGKLTLISPRDIDHPPAINIFDVRRDRLSGYAPAMREQVVAGVIQTFDYLFTGLLGADLTAKQSVLFRFVARLMLALPETMGRNATILDMMNLMDDPAPYREAIISLPPIQRSFFERDFQATSFRQTKEQIRYRLQAILENPTLERLFTSERTKIDFFTEMNEGRVILIDTAKDFLKGSSAHFGRIFISLVLQAALERASIPESKRKPTFLIVDEAADYFDDNIDDLLTQVRKYSVGCLFAHQFLDQCTSSLRSSLAANTSTKLCSSLSVSDARAMAPELRTTPERILKQKKLHFSCFIRGVTPEAINVPVEVGKLERQPKLSHADYQTLLEKNRARVSLTKADLNTGDDARDPKAATPKPEPSSPGAHPWARPPEDTNRARGKDDASNSTPKSANSSAAPRPSATKPTKPNKPQVDPDDSASDW